MGEVSYKGHRYPAEIIAHCVWLYHRFPLSFREVEELMLVRGVIVSYETIRQWCAKFGPEYACRLRRRRKPARRQVASRRGVLDDQRPSAVSVAGRRPGRQRPRHPRPVQARRQGRQAVLPQTPQEAVRVSSGAGHRQAPQLRSGAAGGDAVGRAPAIEIPEQPGGELAPADPATRTRHETLPHTRRSPTVPGGVQRDLARTSGPAAIASPLTTIAPK